MIKQTTPVFAIVLAALCAATPSPAAAPNAGEADRPFLARWDGPSLALPEGVNKDALGKRELRTIAVQVLLDRSRHSPGVIDGYMGANTRRAIRYYRKANGLAEGDAIDGELLNALTKEGAKTIFRTYTVTESDLAQDFKDNPDTFEQMAQADGLPFESPLEMFGERFHMDQDFLRALNPDADFGKAGTKLVIVAGGDESLSADVARIEVRKSENSVALLDKNGGLVASYPATIGSDEFPSPSGTMDVKAIATDPKYYFDPSALSWGPDKRLQIPAGPNNPVGGTWVDLSKEGYGIHGAPDPKMIGKSASHGCVRLTNWDAEEVAKAVSPGTPVEFI